MGAPAVDLGPEPEEDTPVEEPPTDGAAPPAAEEPKVETIRIGKVDVPTADVAKHFDPGCPRRCEFGSRKVGRPFNRRVIYVRELCDCAVLGWLKEHQEPEPIAAGPLARAAADGHQGAAAPAPQSNPRGEQVSRLRARRASLEEKRAAVDAELAADIAPLTEEIACEESIAAATDTIARAARALAEEMTAALADVQRRHWAAMQEEEAARQTIAAAAARTAALRQRVEEMSKLRGGDGRALARDIERIDRRIARIVSYHPEAAGG